MEAAWCGIHSSLVWLGVTYYSDLYTQDTNSGMLRMYAVSVLRIENMLEWDMWCVWNSLFMTQTLVYTVQRFVLQDIGLKIF